jgi:hemin uptake protein HemP
MCPNPLTSGMACDIHPQASDPNGSGTSVGASGSGVRRISTSELLGSASELVIVHGQREYRLRITSNGKLILTA